MSATQRIVPSPAGQAPRRARASAPQPVAFVASLAVGLSSAGWEDDRAVPELVAAAGSRHGVLVAASRYLRARQRDRGGPLRGDAARAVHLLTHAARVAAAAALAS